ncbi:MAG TPA: ATP-dependent zinc metalloprotease FtsH [Planktothrix sp.]|jgi:cell division protease FtsH
MWIRSFIFAAALVVAGLAANSPAFAQYDMAIVPPPPAPVHVAGIPDSLSDLRAALASKQPQISSITLHGQTADVDMKSGGIGHVFIGSATSLESVQKLADAAGVPYNEQPEDKSGNYLVSLLMSMMPLLLMVGISLLIMKRMQGGGGMRGMAFGQNKAKRLTRLTGRITFADVAGIDEAKAELEEVVEFLRNPGKFTRLGGKMPKGVLLVGPPGTGKTLTARAVAGEANVPFFSISGSDFVEMFVGVGASRVRAMFEEGKRNAPCIIFIDEIDAVGRHRGKGQGGGNDEREQTLNQMLVEMDGFEGSEGIILIAATNRPDVLDPALLRPGRFDRQVVVPNPDLNGRNAILRVHSKKVPMHQNVDLMVIARGTPGFSGADLANLINEGALLAARHNKKTVSMEDLEQAKDKVIMGAERRSIAMSDDEKRMTAWHEAGHTVCNLCEELCDPVHKATIVPRGHALGMMVSLPAGDRYSKSKARLLADLVVAMGGRAAEEIKFGADKVSNGASGDIKAATGIARRMVMQWGMSDLGMVLLDDADEHNPFKRACSEETARKIDDAVRTMIDNAYQTAKAHLTKNRAELDRLSESLLEFETLTGEEIRRVFRGELAREPVAEAVVVGPPRPAAIAVPAPTGVAQESDGAVTA